MFPKTTVSTLLSVIIFTGCPFPHPTFMGARGAHTRHHRVRSPSPKFISAIPKTMIRHYSSIIFTCHPFQPSPIPLLRVVLFQSVLLLMLQSFKEKNCLDVLSTGSFPFPTSMDTHIYIPHHPYGDEDLTLI